MKGIPSDIKLRCTLPVKQNEAQVNKMAGLQPKNDSKLSLEIRTKSIEQTLVPLVTQVSYFIPYSAVCANFFVLTEITTDPEPTTAAGISGVAALVDIFIDQTPVVPSVVFINKHHSAAVIASFVSYDSQKRRYLIECIF